MNTPLMRSSVPLRDRLCARDALVGVFQKLSAYHATELLGSGALDYIVLDTEHAAFSRRELDTCLLAARTAGLPCLVRLVDSSAESILAVLDMGATGVVIPRVSDAEKARAVVAAAHYASHGGSRGFSNSPRAGAYGASPMGEHIRQSDSSVVVICQIEDRDGVASIDAIASVAGIHGLLVGPADLTLSYAQSSSRSPMIADAIQAVAAAAAAKGVAAGIAIPDLSEGKQFAQDGFNFLLVGSDQSMIVRGSNALAREFQENVAPLIKEKG